MSLVLSRIAVENFRKFRERTVIDGLESGLNFVIEPNEAGKSTLLEALRAAFFVRHSTRNRLASSFAPYEESVAPEVELTFEIDGVPWSVSKRFLKSPQVELRGPSFRAQGDEAEAKLHELLGSQRDTSQQGDPHAHGALGLLWVGQAAALEVTAPGPMVRDTVRSTLEAEVGTILGGPTFDRVRERIDTQYSDYWTPTGQAARKLVAATEKEQTARAAATAAKTSLEALEQSFLDLESARNRLRVVEREIADPTDAEERDRLTHSLEVARAAAQLLATRKAEQESAVRALAALQDIEIRYGRGKEDREKAKDALAKVQRKRSSIHEELEAAKAALSETRAALAKAREKRTSAREALSNAQAIAERFERAGAVSAARERHRNLLLIERELEEARALSATEIPASAIEQLEASDRSVAEARAALNAGATSVELIGDAPNVKIDGHPVGPEPRVLTGETRIELGSGAVLIVRPPPSAQSAEERLTAAEDRYQSLLAEHSLKDIADARARNQTARDAGANIQTLQARIAGLTAPDPLLAIPAGAEALKLFVSGLESDNVTEVETPISLDELQAASEAADVGVVRAEATHESAVDTLRNLEEADRPLAEAEAGASRDLANANARIAELEDLPQFEALEAELRKARETATEAAVLLAEAERNAQAHDQNEIEAKLRSIDARSKSAGDRRTRLMLDVARLEAQVETEGGKGLADRAAAAQEEAEAASAALLRTTEEADTLKLLRDTLEAARGEASRTFVGPVARRAKRHIERLLPGCELEFNENLGLDTLVRAGLPEGCGNLSRGTQEQLAVLTRLAFADMLLDEGKPVSLILDDPLVYSDDARLDTMTEILIEAADRMQVVLLTCRDRAFRHLPGKRIVLEAPSLS
jgi:hypothetical protein